MFFARIRKDNGSLNGIEIQKLKNKLGTRQLPTAELLLDGMNAFRVLFYTSLKKFFQIFLFEDV